MKKEIFTTFPLLPTLNKNNDQSTSIERISAENMLSKLQYIIDLKVDTILDLGCGLGVDIPILNKLYSPVKIIANDISTENMEKVQQKYCTGFQNFFKKFFKKMHVIPLSSDLQKLPIPNDSIDLIWCNMVLPHVPLHTSFQECLRILKPGGLLLFSTLGKNTLVELKTALIATKCPHSWQLPDIQAIGDILSKTGYQNIVMDIDQYTYTYHHLFAMIRDISQNNFLSPIQLSITQIKSLIRYYQNTHPHPNTQQPIPATIEILYGQCWKTKKNPNKRVPITFHREILHNNNIGEILE